jgi:6-phosphogluconolactonase (cycloisomerase 2 family)
VLAPIREHLPRGLGARAARKRRLHVARPRYTVRRVPDGERVRSGLALAAAVLSLSLLGAGSALATPFVYTANNVSTSLSQFDAAGGPLSPIGPALVPVVPVATGDNPQGAAVSSGGANLYVTNKGSNTISQYDVDPITGAPAAKTPPTLSTGANPLGVLAGSLGPALYVANSGGSTISQYSIGAGGALTAMAIPTVASGASPQRLAEVTVSGTSVLYATDAGGVSQYDIDPTTGALTPIVGAITTGTGARGIAVSQDSKSAYVVNSTDNSISQYDIDQTTGHLTPKSTPTVSTGSLSNPQQVVAGSKAVYVTNKGSNTISQYSASVTGELTSLTPATVSAGAGPDGLSLFNDSNLEHVHAVNTTDGTISQYDADPVTGALTPMTPAVLPTGAGPVALATSASPSVDSFAAYVTNTTDKTISQFDLNANSGRLRVATQPTIPVSSGQPFAVAASANGKSVYATGGSGTVLQYDVSSTGVLVPKSPPSLSAGTEPAGVAVSPDSLSVYVADKGGGTLHQYDADPATGALTPKALPTVSAGAAPTGVAVSPNGNSVYVTDADSGMVLQYDVAAGGALTPKASAAVATTAVLNPEPAGVAVSRDSRNVYVTIDDDNQGRSVLQYDAAADGQLTPKPTFAVPTGGGPNGVALNPDRASAYVVNEDDNTISQFDVSAGGDLSPKAPATVPTGDNPENVVVSPDGGSVYVSAQGDNGLSQFDVSPSGALTPKATPLAAAGGNPIGLAISMVPVAPTASIVAPASGATFTTGQVVNASYSCAAAAGAPPVRSCVGPVANGAPIDTSALGTHQFTVTATSTDGQTATATSTYTVTAVVSPPPPPPTPQTPVLRTLRVKPAAFVAVKGKGSSVAVLKKRKGGATVSYQDSLKATTVFTVYRPVRGHLLKSGKCSIAPVKKGRPRGRACTLLVSQGSFSRSDVAGANKFGFTGRVKKKRLKPGKYVLGAVPHTASKTGKRVTAKFRIKPR